MPKMTNRTLYSWAEIFRLAAAQKFTDSTGTDYWAVGSGKVIDDTGNFVAYTAFELPVTMEVPAEPARPHVYKEFGGTRWITRAGRGAPEYRETWDEAMALANKMAAQR